MSTNRNWGRDGADAFIDHAMPVIREAGKHGDLDNVLEVYSGVLGAWYGSLVADAGPEFAGQAADILFAKVRKLSFKEQMN